MPEHVTLHGSVRSCPSDVIEEYRPSTALIPAERWWRLRPTVVAAVTASRPGSAWTALQSMRYTGQLTAWASAQGLPLNPEIIFTAAQIERFVSTELHALSPAGRATVRSRLRAVARAATTTAAWAPDPKPYARTRPIAPPYTEREVAGFWHAARTQATAHRSRVLLGMLTLGLAAGLRPAEMLTVSARESIRVHPRDRRLWAVRLDDRVVPVRAAYTTALTDLCRDHPDGPLLGQHRATAKDPMGVLRKGIEIPAWLPPLKLSRLRTTWMVSVLSGDLRISEFMTIAGISSAKTLESIAPYVPGRWDGDDYLFRGAGLDAAS